MTATTGTPAPQTLTIDGCELSYQRAGIGEPMLFLHGSGGISGWMPWMEQLSQCYDLIVPDHPGFGRSSTPEWLDNIHDVAYFYLDVMRELGLSRVHLVGNSLGGWLAAEIAVRCTTRLQTLVLVDPAGLRIPGVRVFDIFAANPEATVRHLYHDEALVERALAAPPPDLDTVLKNRLAVARLAWQPRLYDPHLAKWLHRIDLPTLVIWGDDDRLIPPAYADEFARLIPGAQKRIIERCGHLPHVERPDRFVSAVTQFIGSTPG
jgi:pimeloyl-ACP methyl ester carboxylesterase